MFRLLLLTFAVALTTPLTAAEPDWIGHHGHVVTIDAQFRIAEAFAVRGDKIVAVGSNEEVQKLAGAGTEQVDLKGRTVIPGLCDSHVHPTGASLYEFDHPIPDMQSIADVLAYVAERTKVVPEGEWIVMSQVFVTRLRDQRYPTRSELDQVAPKHPVLFSTGPDSSVNSLALALNKIDKDFKITDGQPGFLERDAQGELTGILRSCTRLIKTKSTAKSATPEEREARFKELLASYNSVGLTSLCDRSASEGAIALYAKIRDQGELNCRVFASASVNAQDPLDNIQAAIEKIAASPLHQRNDRLWVRGIKVFLDGGMLTGSAYMQKPWGVSTIYSITDPEYRGLLYIQPDKLRDIARMALKHELQMTAHSVGDGAVQTLVDCYEALDKEFPVRDMRPCVTHCNFMSAEIIQKMQRLGVVADLQPAWLYLDGRTLLRQFGDERLAYFQPYKSLSDSGVIVGGGSDHMQKIGSLRAVNPYNPWLGMWTTLTRQPRGMTEPLHPEQMLTRQQALALYTINNAYLTFQEKEKGSLEPGKLADFVILTKDPLTCSLDELRDMTVEETWLGGKRVWKR